MRWCPNWIHLLATILLLGMAIGCGRNGEMTQVRTEVRPTVVTTIYPMYYFTKVVGGESVDVQTLVTPGTEAHSFEPTPGVMRLLSKADLVVVNGLNLEPWLDRALGSLDDEHHRVVLEATDPNVARAGDDHAGDDHAGDDHAGDDHAGDDHAGDDHAGDDHAGDDHAGDDHAGHHHEIDPHVWLDPVLAIGQVQRIRNALIELNPVDADGYRTRADALIHELENLRESFTTRLSNCHHRHFVTTHAAYGYLADRFDLEQIPILGLSPDAEPSARDLANVIDRVSALGLRYLLVEPLLSTRLADTVAFETGLILLPIHQLESVTDGELDKHGDYLGLMRDNLESLTTALECAA